MLDPLFDMKGVAGGVSIATAALAGVLYVYENLAYLQVLHSLPTGLAAVTALQTEHLAMDPCVVGSMLPKPVLNHAIASKPT